jgi:flagellar assembly factor FliW
VTIDTHRFGEIEIPEEAVLTLLNGMWGFPEAKRFALLPYSPEGKLHWLQSVDDPTLCFLAVEPHHFFQDYEVVLADADATLLGLQEAKDAALLSVLTLHRDTSVVTVNLAGPIVINVHSRLGRQVVMDDPRYTTRHLLTDLSKSLERNAEGVAPC